MPERQPRGWLNIAGMTLHTLKKGWLSMPESVAQYAPELVAQYDRNLQ